MKISTSTFTVLDAPGIGDEAGIRLLAEAGFDALDFSFFYWDQDPRFQMSDEEHTAYYRHLKNIADDCGLEIFQAHSPMPDYHYTGDEGDDNLYIRLQTRAIKAAALLGARYIVVHPVVPAGDLRPLDAVPAEEGGRLGSSTRPLDDPYASQRAAAQEINYKYYSRLKPYCEEYGIRIAIENLFNYDTKAEKIVPTVCSTAWEMKSYVDMMGRDCFTNCLDLGHALVTGRRPQDMIRELGDYIGCLHVHDNDGVHDLHQAPRTGIADWAEIMQAIRKIPYKGTFNMEADMFYYGYGQRLYKEAGHFLYCIGKDLVENEG